MLEYRYPAAVQRHALRLALLGWPQQLALLRTVCGAASCLTHTYPGTPCVHLVRPTLIHKPTCAREAPPSSPDDLRPDGWSWWKGPLLMVLAWCCPVCLVLQLAETEEFGGG